MSPKDKDDEDDNGVGAEDDLGRDSGAGQAEKKREDQLHRQEFDIVGNVVRRALKSVL